MLKKCVICGGKLERKKVDYVQAGVNLGKFEAQVCKCGEEYFDEKTVNIITEMEKKAGLFGIAKRTKISYSGKSLMVRIPKDIAQLANFKRGTEVQIMPEGKGKILIQSK